MARFDAFLSYATEDERHARMLFDELKLRGFCIWFAPTQLKLGDPLFRSIEVAMTKCHYGILLISDTYLNKPWTTHEMDTMRRATVERRKQILPILLGLNKATLEAREPSLSNVITANMDHGVPQVAAAIGSAIAGGAPTIGSIPIYMDPSFLFLSGEGEISIRTSNGSSCTTTIFEFLVHSGAADYRLFLDGERYSLRHLAWMAAGASFHNPHLAKKRLSVDEMEQFLLIIQRVVPEYSIDPEEVANMSYEEGADLPHHSE